MKIGIAGTGRMGPTRLDARVHPYQRRQAARYQCAGHPARGGLGLVVLNLWFGARMLANLGGGTGGAAGAVAGGALAMAGSALLAWCAFAPLVANPKPSLAAGGSARGWGGCERPGPRPGV